MAMLVRNLKDKNSIGNQTSSVPIILARLAETIISAGQEHGWTLTTTRGEATALGRKVSAVAVKREGMPDVYVVAPDDRATKSFDVYVKDDAAGSDRLKGAVARQFGIVGNIMADRIAENAYAKRQAAYQYYREFTNSVLARAIELAKNPFGNAPAVTPAADNNAWTPVGNGGAANAYDAGVRISPGGTVILEDEAEIARRQAEEQRRAEQARRAEEQRKAEQARRAQAQYRAEQARLAEEARRAREREEQNRRQEAARRQAQLEAKRSKAATSKSNELGKLVYITSAEAAHGCTKQVKLSDGRQVTISIPPGTTYETLVRIPGEGYMDKELGIRGELVVSFALLD